MALPAGIAAILANSPRAIQVLQGLGVLTGGTIAATEAQKQLQNLPEGSLEEAYKRVFLGPAYELSNLDVFKTKTPEAEDTTLKAVTSTPSGLVLGPTLGEIDEAREQQKKMLQPPVTEIPTLYDDYQIPPTTAVDETAFSKPLITIPPKEAGEPIIETFPVADQASKPIITTMEKTKGEAEPVTEEKATTVFKPKQVDTQRVQQIQNLAPTTQLPGVGPLTFDPRQIKTTGQYVGLPEGTTNPDKLQKIRDDAYQLYDTGKEGRYWYRDSAKTILDSVNGDVQEADKIAQLIGVFSAGSPVGTDLGYALQAYSAYQNGQDIFTGRFPKAQSEKAKRILEGESWEGRKTNNFYKAIAREFNPELTNEPVIDIWMMRAYGFPNFEGTPTEAQYSTVSQELKNTLGQVQQIDPTMDMNQLQAAIWVGAKAKKVGDKDKATFNYANAIQNNLGQISWESAPGASTNNLTGFSNLPYQDRQEYHVEASKVFLDDKGSDILAKTIGVLTPNEFEAPGHYMDETNPGSQTEVIIPKAYKEGQALDKNTVALVDAYAAAKGLVLGQEAVPWHRPFYTDSSSKADGISVRLGEEGKIATVEETKALSQAANRIASDMAGREINDFNLIGAKEGGRFLNVAFDEKGDKVFTNKQFIDIISKAVNEVFPGEQTVRLKYFASDGNYIANDWSKNLNGEDYIRTIGQAGPDIQKRVLDLLPTLIQKKYQLDKGFGEKHNLSTNESINSNYRKKITPGSSGSGSAEPVEKKSKYTLSRELDPKLLDEMLMMRGGVKGFEESMQRDNAPLPPSTKRQMFIRYNEKIMDKYGFDKTDKDPETMPPEELKKLRQKYFTKQDAVDYIVSAAYDVIGGKKELPNEDTIFALDDEGLPVAAVKMGMGNLFGKGRMEGIAIEEAGSLFPEAMDMVIEEAKKVAKENGKKFLVAEDLTSDAAYNAFIKRGFKPAKNKRFNIFEGKLVYRPGGGRKVKQKNLVLELE